MSGYFEDDLFNRAFEAALAERQATFNGRDLLFLCPAHDDNKPSARWNAKKRVWHCFPCGAGGGMLDLAKHLGVPPPFADGLTLNDLADYVGLPPGYLRSVGVAEGTVGIERAKCVDIPYTDQWGEVKSVRKRLRLTGEPRMVWRRGDHVEPYGLTRLPDARKAGYLLLVEGESDAWTAWHAGVPAIGIPGASTWREEWKRHLMNIAVLFVWREGDRGGDTFTAKIASDLPDVRVVEPPPGLKDLSSLWHASGHEREVFRARLEELQKRARPAAQLRAEALGTEARKLMQTVRPLLRDPQLLQRIRAAIRDGGYVGDLTAPLMAYLALTSRLLERPLNLAFVAPSGAGKNRAVDGALEIMPEDAYHLEKAGSARALIYSEQSFEHRAVIVAEADSIPQDEGSAASAIRSLAEDGYMTYDVVIADPSTGEFKTRRIVKAGPTSLITTSTRPLKEQLSTRTLTVTINDSPEQTREVLKAHAASVNGHRPSAGVSALVDLQRWLTIAGDREVTVPYSQGLAEMVPVTHVRMRRDFRQLLTVIQAMALLHQAQRDRDEQGRIVATLNDYAWTRELILGAFTTAATDGVTPAIRETVEGLESVLEHGEEECTRKQLAEELKLAPRTVGDRLARAIALGYVVNLETRERQPGRYKLGDPLPENRPPLPTLEELSAYVCVADRETSRHYATPFETQVQPEPEISVADTESDSHATPTATLEAPHLDSEIERETAPWRRGGPERLAEGTDPLLYCEATGCVQIVSSSRACPLHGDPRRKAGSE